MHEEVSPEAPGVDGPGVAEAPGLSVVGVGASAGGLEAFTRLLRALPTDTGHAFVLVQHLDASHPSSLGEILSRATAMPVRDAADGMPVAPNQVFVISPNTELTIKNRVLRVRPRPQAPGGYNPIDRFLTSLARDCHERCAGVILSGAGADGTDGLHEIRTAGGVTYAQDPTTAEFPSMPTMAAAAGGADFVLPPEEIAEALGRLTFSRLLVGESATPVDEDEDTAHEMRALCDVMHESTGIDFSLYRGTTIERRVRRRMILRGLDRIADYTAVIVADTDERTALQRDLLIGVTSFFRDPPSFDALTALVFPTLFRERDPSDTIRVWVPGCATGEEAYSILIALHEYQQVHGTTLPVQVFGSDISDAAIDTARGGRYPATIAAEVSPERLREYFTVDEAGYKIATRLREQCVFSRHNLIDDPPFSKLDLISCRNVLIYLETVQKQIIPLFHYALREPGFLMLGRSETAHFPDLFSAVEPRLRIFAKRHVARRPYGFAGRRTLATRGTDGRTVTPPQAIAARDGRDLGRQADRIMLSKYSPPGVLVDDNLEVLEIRGKGVPFLTLPTGRVSFHLLKLIADTGLFLAVEQLVTEAAATGEPTRREGVDYEAGGQQGQVNVEVRPLFGKDRRACLILFELKAEGAGGQDAPGHAHDDSDSVAAARDRLIEKLKREVDAARQRLLTLIEEHDTTDQETQQVAEDALSTNEELQSLSEELETAKEELQSTNEELITVNRDLESRNRTLVTTQQLARTIVETIGVPLVVLDHVARVQSVNAAFTQVFGIASAEVESRSVYEIGGGAFDVAALRAAVERLRTTRRPFDRLEMTPTVALLGARVLLASGASLDDLDLALLTFEDVTARRDAEQALRRSEQRRRQAERLETVGRLAGGVAHDFNNLLTVIIGYCGLLTETLSHDDEAADQVEQIRISAERAAILTDQLLAFSRRKVLQPRAFDLNAVLKEFERMMRRLLGPEIGSNLRLASDLPWAEADPGEIGRVLMNLSLNARDAMPAGGTLTFETARTVVDAARASVLDIAAGTYVELTVRDTGYGMTEEMVSHVFEPFFTTKEAHRGGGLGLSSVYGLVRQSKGAVSCRSEEGRGTEFTVLLPAAGAPTASPVPADNRPTHATEGSAEVVLLVDDEAGVRGLSRRILEANGYVVIDASDGREALDILTNTARPINILVSDILLPGIDGRALTEQALALRPDIKVLFVSGHTHESMAKSGARTVPFLQKPFAPNTLARTVRAVLDSTHEGGSTL